MKNRSIYKSIAILSLILVFTTCSKDRLDITPQDLTESDYFKNELDFHKAIGGVYAKVGEFYHFHYNNPRHMFYLLPGDDLTTDGDIPFEVFSTLEAGNDYVSTQFGYAYELIARANVALEKLYDDEFSSVITTPNVKDYLIGEALFLRSYMNILIWNYWGPAPNVTKRIVSQDDINPPSSEGTELLDQAITDLGEAANLLPATWADSDKGRVTKNSANGLLGKALVIRGSWIGSNSDYTAAITAFGKISGASLIADYADNFSVNAENNDESLYEYQSSNIGGDNIWLSNDVFSSIGTFSAYYGYFTNHWSFWAQTPYVATQKFMDTFEAGDPRAAATFDPATGFILKYVTRDALTNGTTSFNNPRILRYADVLLLWAEALNETGDQAGAVDKINEVRTRARNMDITGVPADKGSGNQDEVRTWIQEERLMELGAEEGHRWIDLRRWHQANHINLATWDFSSRKADFNISLPKNLYYPIPSSELDKNPEVKQNSGY